MKINTFIIVCIVILINLTGCSTTLEGYIVQVDTEKILVLSSVEVVSWEQIEGKPLAQLLEENADLTYYSYKDTSKLHVGDKIKIWTNGIAATSYPAKATATKIKIIEE